MEQLRQEFLDTSVSSLSALQKECQTGDFFSDSFLHKLFRQLHTIKGTAQTFDFKTSGDLAHEIENVLQALRENKLGRTDDVALTIKEGIKLLCETLQNEQTQSFIAYPQFFAEKIRNLTPDLKTAEQSETLTAKIPPNLLAKLAGREIDALNSAMQNGYNFFVVNVAFDLSDFDIKLKEFREILNSYGEIIAVSPGENADLPNRLGFQLFFVSKIETSEIVKAIEPFKASFRFESRTTFGNFDLQNILSQIVVNGEKTACLLGKKINFQIISDNIILSPEQLKNIYEILLHLVRNAADHAIEIPDKRIAAQKDDHGKVEIAVTIDENKIVLRVADDGRGINTDEIVEKALQQGFITSPKNLNESEALEILFTYGFSTSNNVSEISGRGVGLDIVKEITEKANGHTKIQTKLGQGTIFEVYLPH